MPETERKVQPIEVNYLCDECRIGNMFYIFQIDDSNPHERFYIHQCDFEECENQKKFRVKYPFIRYIKFNHD